MVNIVDGLEDSWIDVAGVKTHFVTAGKGEPVLLIHGGHAGDPVDADSIVSWDTIIPNLGQDYHVLAVDRLGQGLTAHPEKDKDWSLESSVSHIQTFIEQKGVGAVHLVGHGAGALIALAIAVRKKTLIRTLTLVSGYLAAPVPPRHELLFSENSHPFLSAEALNFTVESASFDIAHATPAWRNARIALLQSDSHRIAVRKMEDEGLYENLFRAQLPILRDNLIAELSQRALNRPALLIWGFDDRVAPLEGAYALFELLGQHEHHVELHVINRCGHYPFREHPSEFTSVLTRFLKDAHHGV
jgi:pimeloyl-ACP methyl ester carboxylesterase